MGYSDPYKPKVHGGLGFRKLQYFNRALLRKQGWRVIRQPNILAALVLKAKYSARMDFWGATLGYQPSYTWRRLLKAGLLVEKGCKRRVESAIKIQIWQDILDGAKYLRLGTH